MVLLTLCGCEDVIDLNLSSVEPRIVIEGVVDTPDQIHERCYFYITRTTDFYDPTVVEGVSGALVVVTNDQGQADTLVGQSNDYGLYIRPVVRLFKPRMNYTAVVTVEGQEYTAFATMPEYTPIDSIGFEYQSGGGYGIYTDEGYRLHVYFRDQPDSDDYARIELPPRNGDFYLYDGRFSDGNSIDYEYFLIVFPPGVSIDVTLTALEKPMFDYLVTLSEVAANVEGNSFDVSPANPNSNWSNEALGYFGAFNKSVRSVEVPRQKNRQNVAHYSTPAVTGTNGAGRTCSESEILKYRSETQPSNGLQ